MVDFANQIQLIEYPTEDFLKQNVEQQESVCGRGNLVVQLGDVVDQFHNIGTLKIIGKNIPGAFLFIDLLQDVGYIHILPLIQVKNGATIIRQYGKPVNK